MREFDAIFIGAGQAGPFLAARMAAIGRKVALIERKYLGGTCVNAGCMPTKTLVSSARSAHMARRAADFGVLIGGEICMDMKAVRARAAKVTLDVRNGLRDWFAGLDTMTVIDGHARLENAKTISVEGDRMTAPQIFLNVGARSSIPNYPGLADVPYLTSTSIIQLDSLPRHLLVIGGSHIGLEFAQMYRRFGAQVTILERGSRVASREDADISASIAAILQSEGIAIHTNVSKLSFERAGGEIAVETNDGSILASHVLVATGRQPNTDDLGLEAAGVEVDKRGFVVVDNRLATNVDGIWALGDCNGRGAFTHTSYNDFEIVAANLLDGADRRVSDRVPAYAL